MAGTISSKRASTKIDSVNKLSIALLSLGRVMPHKDSPFSLTESTSYMTRIIGLASTYSLESVMEFEFELQKWMTYWKLLWNADNRVIADTFLLPLQRLNPKNPKKRRNKNVCPDFNKGVCSRAKCCFRHVCLVCGQDHTVTACPEAQKP